MGGEQTFAVMLVVGLSRELPQRCKCLGENGFFSVALQVPLDHRFGCFNFAALAFYSG